MSHISKISDGGVCLGRIFVAGGAVLCAIPNPTRYSTSVLFPGANVVKHPRTPRDSRDDGVAMHILVYSQ